MCEVAVRKPLHLAVVVAALAGSLMVAGAPPEDAALPLRLDSWERTAWQQVGTRDLDVVAGSQAALLREYGSLQAERATYRRAKGEWAVVLHRLQDRSGAYGAFTLLGRNGQPVPLGEGGAGVGDAYLFYQANYLVSARGQLELAALHRLAQELKARAGFQASLPSLPFYLPQEGFVTDSDRYLLGPLGMAAVAPLAAGDWVGFAYGAEVEAARYRVGDGEATLLLISYPTPQIARERLRDFRRLFNLNGGGDARRPEVYAKRTGTLVAFVSGVGSNHASQLLERVRYETKISWSDPSDPRPEPEWGKTLLNLFIGTGLFLLFALLSGIAYGLLRLVVKRAMPGRVFDRPEDTEVITLNLRGHRR